MNFVDICNDIANKIKPNSTAMEIVTRLSAQVVHFAIEELRSNPFGAFRATLTKDEVKERIEQLKHILQGRDSLNFSMLNEFTFSKTDADSLTYEVKMCRTGAGTHNWPNIATFRYDLETFGGNIEKYYIKKVTQDVLTAREQFHEALTNDEGVVFKSKPLLFSFLNFFTTNPEVMMRHGYMLFEDLDDKRFAGVHIKPIKKKGTDLVMGVSMKFNHLTSETTPQIYIPVVANRDTASGIPLYDMRAAEDYDIPA